MKKKLQIALLVLALLVSPFAWATFYNSPACNWEAEGLDCWRCKRPPMNPGGFCWMTAAGEAGYCGCSDIAPYGQCHEDGEFCEWIVIVG